MFHNQETQPNSVESKIKLESKVTKTDVLANNQEWLKTFEKILSDSNLLKINQTTIDWILRSFSQTNVTQSEASERISVFICLMTERKFLLNLVKSLVTKVLTIAFNTTEQVSKKQSPTFENEPILEKEFSKHETVSMKTPVPYTKFVQTPAQRSHSVGRSSSPAQQEGLRQIFGIQPSPEGSEFVLLTQQPRGQQHPEEFVKISTLIKKDYDRTSSPFQRATDAIKKIPFQNASSFQQRPQNEIKVSSQPYQRLAHQRNQTADDGQNQTRYDQTKASGLSLMREYNALFKRKEFVSLTHKWSSDEDDECADVMSETSNGQTQESFEFSRTEIEAFRYTGTFGKGNGPRTAEKPRNVPSGAKGYKQSFLSLVKATPHQKPVSKTIVHGNFDRANVRMSQKESIRQKKRRDTALAKIANEQIQQKNGQISANQTRIELPIEIIGSSNTPTNRNILEQQRPGPAIVAADASFISNAVFNQAAVSLSAESKSTTQLNVQQLSDGLSASQMESQLHSLRRTENKQAVQMPRMTMHEENKVNQQSPQTLLNQTREDRKSKKYLPSYQSNDFEEQRSSGRSPSKKELQRAKSANRYSAALEEEDLQPRESLIQQIDNEADLERELHVLTIDISARPEYTHTGTEVVKKVQTSNKSMRKTNASHGQNGLGQVKESASSIFKNEHYQGSPELSNRMREIQSQASEQQLYQSSPKVLDTRPKENPIQFKPQLETAEKSKTLTNTSKEETKIEPSSSKLIQQETAKQVIHLQSVTEIGKPKENLKLIPVILVTEFANASPDSFANKQQNLTKHPSDEVLESPEFRRDSEVQAFQMLHKDTTTFRPIDNQPLIIKKVETRDKSFTVNIKPRMCDSEVQATVFTRTSTTQARPSVKDVEIQTLPIVVSKPQTQSVSIQVSIAAAKISNDVGVDAKSDYDKQKQQIVRKSGVDTQSNDGNLLHRLLTKDQGADARSHDGKKPRALVKDQGLDARSNASWSPRPQIIERGHDAANFTLKIPKPQVNERGASVASFLNDSDFPEVTERGIDAASFVAVQNKPPKADRAVDAANFMAAIVRPQTRDQGADTKSDYGQSTKQLMKDTGVDAKSDKGKQPSPVKKDLGGDARSQNVLSPHPIMTERGNQAASFTLTKAPKDIHSRGVSAAHFLSDTSEEPEMTAKGVDAARFGKPQSNNLQKMEKEIQTQTQQMNELQIQKSRPNSQITQNLQIPKKQFTFQMTDSSRLKAQESVVSIEIFPIKKPDVSHLKISPAFPAKQAYGSPVQEQKKNSRTSKTLLQNDSFFKELPEERDSIQREAKAIQNKAEQMLKKVEEKANKRESSQQDPSNLHQNEVPVKDKSISKQTMEYLENEKKLEEYRRRIKEEEELKLEQQLKVASSFEFGEGMSQRGKGSNNLKINFNLREFLPSYQRLNRYQRLLIKMPPLISNKLKSPVNKKTPSVKKDKSQPADDLITKKLTRETNPVSENYQTPEDDPFADIIEARTSIDMEIDSPEVTTPDDRLVRDRNISEVIPELTRKKSEQPVKQKIVENVVKASIMSDYKWPGWTREPTVLASNDRGMTFLNNLQFPEELIDTPQPEVKEEIKDGIKQEVQQLEPVEEEPIIMVKPMQKSKGGKMKLGDETKQLSKEDQRRINTRRLFKVDRDSEQSEDFTELKQRAVFSAWQGGMRASKKGGIGVTRASALTDSDAESLQTDEDIEDYEEPKKANNLSSDSEDGGYNNFIQTQRNLRR